MGGGHIDRNTVQCVLAGNIINEKVFIGLLLWLIILNGLTAINFFCWVYRLFFYKNRLEIVKELLPSYVTDILYPIADDDLKIVQSKIEPLDIKEFDMIALEELKSRFEETCSNSYPDSTTTQATFCSEKLTEKNDTTDNQLKNQKVFACSLYTYLSKYILN